MLMPGRKYEAQNGYRYGFNGKEKDKDINSLTAYDYGFRIYNPGIGKFLSVDPLMNKYPSWSPYPFAMNCPISGIDLDGLEYYFSADGKFLGHVTKDSKGNALSEEITNSVRLASSMEVTKDGLYIFKDVKDLNINIYAFNRIAGAAYAEARTDNHDEIYAFANAMVNNAKNSKRSLDQIAGLTTNNGPHVSNAIFDGNAKYKEYMKTLYVDNNVGMNLAQAGLINALNGGKDYSNGADGWDGNDALSGYKPSWDINKFFTHREQSGGFKGVYDPTGGNIATLFYNNVMEYAKTTGNEWILTHTKQMPLYNNFSEEDKKKYIPFKIATCALGTSIFYKSNEAWLNKLTKKFKSLKPL